MAVLPITEIERDNSDKIITVYFDAHELKEYQQKPTQPLPGQFYMLWLPEADQKPYSVSYYNDGRIGFTVKLRGCFSKKLFEAKEGDPIGLLGPLGSPFNLDYDNYLLVGGGIGCAPMLFAAAELYKSNKKFSLFVGAEEKPWLKWVEPLLDKIVPCSKDLITYCTEDGSWGHKGMITDWLKHTVRCEKSDYTLLCGPELFTKKAIHILTDMKIPGQASIERMMKCGIGICGSCSVDHTGDRVCIEGPMFDFDYLLQMKEFGSYFMDETGAVIQQR